MDTSVSLSNTETWPPSWEGHPKFSALLRPYSSAAVVNDGSRPRPEVWDICNGCILWLPPKANIGEIADSRLSNRDPAFFDHPILVLGIQITSPQAATVQFAQMTSLRKRSLEQDVHRSHWNKYLPVFPASSHPKSGTLLHLEEERPNRGMAENSYISIGEGVFSLDFRALRCYGAGRKADGYRHRLTEDSFDQVTRALDYSSSAWVETGMLWEEFVKRHVPTTG